MSKGALGNFSGTTAANANMVDIFRRSEIESYQNSVLAFAERMITKKISIQYDPGTGVFISGCDILVVSSVFELGYGQIDITSLAFKQAVTINIYYMY